MSYGFTLNFKHLDDGLAAVMPFAQSVADKVYGNLESFLRENYVWVPSIRNPWMSDIDESFKNRINAGWIEKVMKLDFIWFKEFNLIALSGDFGIDEVGKLFQSKVYFQNSCDQDYELSSWSCPCEPFVSTVEICKNANFETAQQLLAERYPSGIDIEKEEFDEDPGYYSRWAAYQKIFNDLDLGYWLYDKPSEKFFRFSLSALNSDEKSFQAELLLKKILMEDR